MDFNDNTETQEVAIYIDNSDNKTAVVKTKKANALGLYDMSGNVWEWNFDLSESNRVLRGGGWISNAYYMQVGSWGNNTPKYEDSNSGFRFGRSH
jgi:sulfatase modifying factor 1